MRKTIAATLALALIAAAIAAEHEYRTAPVVAIDQYAETLTVELDGVWITAQPYGGMIGFGAVKNAVGQFTVGGELQVRVEDTGRHARWPSLWIVRSDGKEARFVIVKREIEESRRLAR